MYNSVVSTWTTISFSNVLLGIIRGDHAHFLLKLVGTNTEAYTKHAKRTDQPQKN